MLIFNTSITTTYPTIDCVFLNAGVQSRFDFSKPETVDLQEFQDEIHVNFISFVALAHGFLPYLISKPSAGLILYVHHLCLDQTSRS